MTNKEYKEYLNSLTLGEVKSNYYRTLENINIYKLSIQEDSLKLSQLDLDSKDYNYYMEKLIDDLKSSKSFIKDCLKDLKIIEPILKAKELENIDQTEYEQYINDNNDNIKLLIKAVNEKEQQFIEDGCKITVCYQNKTKEIVITEKEAHEMHDTMLKETILIIKNYCGDILKISELISNGNRGFDCKIKGTKGTISINTILAGGYNIQKLHYRTLVSRW